MGARSAACNRARARAHRMEKEREAALDSARADVHGLAEAATKKIKRVRRTSGIGADDSQGDGEDLPLSPPE